MRVLLAEDDQMLGDGLSRGLEYLGYSVDWVRDGLEAESAIAASDFDAFLLDLGLPGQDGLVLLEKLRNAGNDIPVLVLTARDTLEDRITGLDRGADDYLVKPFDLKEVAARLRAIVRRRAGHANPLVEYGALCVDPEARTVTLDGARVNLSGHEFVVLEALLNQLGRVVPRAKLEEHLYGWDEGAESNVLEVCIHHLRRKLGKQLIQTVRGVGYIVPRKDDGGSQS